ncbi:ML3 [Symbiodinium natans]|uniref:ML3 protein n=1 Tax=Symbiodinium natans TaxID=878477 RepID=A0A812S157_9DINO|nr:ML3 [Symbiodinium natans]
MLKILDGFAAGRYDFVYIPHDQHKDRNVALAFVNFVDHSTAKQAFTFFQNTRDPLLGAGLRVAEAHHQGLGENLAFFVARFGLREVENPSAPQVFKDGVRVDLLAALTEHVNVDLLAEAVQRLKISDKPKKSNQRPGRQPRNNWPAGDGRRTYSYRCEAASSRSTGQCSDGATGFMATGSAAYASAGPTPYRSAGPAAYSSAGPAGCASAGPAGYASAGPAGYAGYDSAGPAGYGYASAGPAASSHDGRYSCQMPGFLATGSATYASVPAASSAYTPHHGFGENWSMQAAPQLHRAPMTADTPTTGWRTISLVPISSAHHSLGHQLAWPTPEVFAPPRHPPDAHVYRDGPSPPMFM